MHSICRVMFDSPSQCSFSPNQFILELLEKSQSIHNPMDVERCDRRTSSLTVDARFYDALDIHLHSYNMAPCGGLPVWTDLCGIRIARGRRPIRQWRDPNHRTLVPGQYRSGMLGGRPRVYQRCGDGMSTPVPCRACCKLGKFPHAVPSKTDTS
jgi:hypothetical protein